MSVHVQRQIFKKYLLYYESSMTVSYIPNLIIRQEVARKKLYR